MEQCQRLEELSLEHNCITKFEGVSCLKNLRRLSLGHNYISSVESSGLDHLHHLHYLSLDGNKISTLLGLQRAHALVEIYLANNKIENLREIFYLKVSVLPKKENVLKVSKRNCNGKFLTKAMIYFQSLSNLIILDMHGNPLVTGAENYRLFVIYHLKSLKALDGTTIV